MAKSASDAMLDCVPESTRHILDGGSLLHRVPWQLGTRYGEIAKHYADFTIRHYGPDTTVVFDGCEEGPSIKDNYMLHYDEFSKAVTYIELLLNVRNWNRIM